MTTGHNSRRLFGPSDSHPTIRPSPSQDPTSHPALSFDFSTTCYRLASFFGVKFATPVHSFNCHSSHMHTRSCPARPQAQRLLSNTLFHCFFFFHFSVLFTFCRTVFNVTLSTYCFVCQTKAEVYIKICAKYVFLVSYFTYPIAAAKCALQHLIYQMVVSNTINVRKPLRSCKVHLIRKFNSMFFFFV